MKTVLLRQPPHQLVAALVTIFCLDVSAMGKTKLSWREKRSDLDVLRILALVVRVVCVFLALQSGGQTLLASCATGMQLSLMRTGGFIVEKSAHHY